MIIPFDITFLYIHIPVILDSIGVRLSDDHPLPQAPRLNCYSTVVDYDITGYRIEYGCEFGRSQGDQWQKGMPTVCRKAELLLHSKLCNDSRQKCMASCALKCLGVVLEEISALSSPVPGRRAPFEN